MINDQIHKLFNDLYLKHGISPKSVKNISKAQLNIRFKYLFNSVDIDINDKILDVGCGYGEMLPYLRKKKIGKDYLGLDYIKGFIDHANKKYEKDKKAKFKIFDLKKNNIVNNFDWVVSSGLFHDKRNDSSKFFYETISKMYSASQKGIMFNAMSTHVDYRDPTLFYLSPEKVINFIIKNLSKKVLYRSDYQTKKDVIPYEFTVCIRKFKR